MEREYIKALGGVPGASGSTWLAPPAVQRPSITGDHTADAIVVGAGIVGALVAFELASRGLQVVLLERRRIAGGTTGHSTAKITVLHGTEWSTRLARRRSDAALAEWAGLNAEAPAAFGDLVTSRSIECGFRRLDAHLVAATPAAEASVVSELNALRRLGVEVEDLGRMPDSPLGDTRGIRIAGQAQFDSAAFTVGLIDSLPGDQITVAEASPVRGLDREGRMWCARLDSATVRAPYAVMTALAPVRDPALLFTRLYPYAAYAFEFMPASPPPDGFWLQADNDGITLRPTEGPNGSWIAGGQHIRLASEADERAVYQRLYRAVESRFPGCRPIRHWSTHDLSTPDGVPFVGRVGSRDGLYMIGGFGGWGISESLPAARLLADTILGAAREPLASILHEAIEICA